MSRVVKVLVLALGALMLALAGVLSWLLWTESGTRFTVQQARGFLPAGVEPGAVRGALGSHLEVDGLTLEQPGMHLTIGHVSLRWSAAALLNGTLHVNALDVRDVRYRALARQPPSSDEPFELPSRVELPLAVTVDALTVRNVQLISAPGAEPIVVDRIAVTNAGFTTPRLTVGRVEVDAPVVSARGDIAATAEGDYPLALHVRWQAEPPGYAPLEANTEVTGSLAALQLDQRFAAPYAARIEGTVQHLLDPQRTLAVDGNLTIDDLELMRLRQDLPDATVSLHAEASGPIDGLDIRATARGSTAMGGATGQGGAAAPHRFVAELAARLEEQALLLQRLSVRQPERRGRLTGRGRVALAGNVQANLNIDWRDLAWPLAGAPAVQSPHGKVTMNGPLDDYRLSLATRLVAPDLPPLDLHVDGKGSRDALAADVAARSRAGNATGHVEAAWRPQVQGDVRVDLTGVKPAVLLEGWPGELGARLAGSARMTDQGMGVVVEQLDVDGTLRRLPLSLSAHGEYAQQGNQRKMEVRELRAGFGPNRIAVQGRVDRQADLHWELASDDLSTLLPALRGRVSGSGQVTGPVPRVRVATQVQGTELGYEGHRFRHLDLRADMDLSGTSPSQLHFEARQGMVAETPVPPLGLDVSGTPAEHRIRLGLEAQPAQGVLELSGRLDDPWGAQPTWHFTVSQGHLDPGDDMRWQLARPAGGVLSARRLVVEEQCWRASPARLCFRGERDTAGLAGGLRLEGLPFRYFAGLLPEGMSLRGGLDATADVEQPADGALTARADVRTHAGELSLPPGAQQGMATSVPLQPSTLHLTVDRSEARARLDLNTGRGWVRAQAATPAALVTGAGSTAPADQPLSARLRLDVPELAFLSRLLPTVEQVRGRIGGDLQLAGTVGEPRVTGSVDLTEGAVSVPESGLTISDLRASLEGRGRDGLDILATGASGGGNVRVAGRMHGPGAPLWARLAITGNEFQVMNTDEARMFLSPDLQVNADARQIRVSGEVRVPRADITPGTPAPTAVTASQDQVLVSDQPEASAQRELHADVRVILGEGVRFEGFGLTAGLSGNVLIQQRPDSPTTATGEVQVVDGEYRAYGQGLVIEEGRVYFAGGPVTQPALDIRAVRRPEEGVLVGTHVAGTLQEPTFELFSEPAMTQQEQLSYLVLGRSLDDAPEGQSSALNRAVLAMGLKGGDFLARNLGKSLGVDQIGIQSGSGEAGSPSEPEQAELVVGKYLSPRLYVSYGIGLFDPESVLQMQYDIARNWRLVTESGGEATGADLLYSIERGR